MNADLPYTLPTFGKVKKVQWEYRLGGIARLAYCSDEELMQIPDNIRKCVAFIASKSKSNDYDMHGTVFFVGYPYSSKDEYKIYAVTARHVIDEFKQHGHVDTYIRLNTRSQGAQCQKIPLASWLYNDEDRIDVAVLPVELDFRLLDHLFLPLNLFVNDDIINKKQIGIGDDLVFPGLFSGRRGDSKNIPIVRLGNIAAMPEEPITSVKWGVLPSAYLIEARSIGGLSGSPVFFATGQSRSIGNMISMGQQPEFFLLGLIHGHYDIAENTWDRTVEIKQEDLINKSMNMGIAMVIPSQDILTTLDRSDLKQVRKIESDAIIQQKTDCTVLDGSFFTSIDVTARTNDVADRSNLDQTKDSMSNKGSPMNP
jgi:hypothetical protein